MVPSQIATPTDFRVTLGKFRPALVTGSFTEASFNMLVIKKHILGLPPSSVALSLSDVKDLKRYAPGLLNSSILVDLFPKVDTVVSPGNPACQSFSLLSCRSLL